jgi:SPP1 family predicted phage head-tail adaptor
MSAGQYRHSIQLRIPVTASDGEGGQTVTWTDGPQIWATVLPISAREQSLAGAVQNLATYRVLTHYDTRITGERRFKRLMPTGPELQILGVQDPDGRLMTMTVDCAEVV